MSKKATDEKRVYFKQADFPQSTLQQAQRIASALVDNFAGDSGSPPDVALALGISPTSSTWPLLTGASIAYGLTDGGVNANVIKLTSLGKRLVAPEAEGEDVIARREAILKPRILREFFEKYRRAKLPNDTIAANVLKALGLPGDRTEAAIEVIKANGSYAGIIRTTPTGPFINLDSPGVPPPTATPDLGDRSSAASHSDDTSPGVADTPPIAAITASPAAALRVLGVALYSLNTNDLGLSAVLDEYLARGTYYYNVVTWLDRLLYAPEPYGAAFRKELRDKVFADENIGEEPALAHKLRDLVLRH
jgi:hypothetical protein